MGNHRADRRGPSRVATASIPDVPADPGGPSGVGGRRKATRSERRVPALLRKAPASPTSIPTIVGAVALAAAAVGTVGVGPSLPGGHLTLSSNGSTLSGTDAIAWADRDPRAQAISRDSERQALKDAAAADLQQVAEAASQQRNAALASQAKEAEARADEIAKNLWVAPTVGYHLTARFGQSSGLWAHFHTGLDFAAPYGSPIFAIANGVITDTGYDGSYGNKTVETLPDGTEIWYCHQSAIGVNVGEKVIQGHQIGNLGSTGNVTGPHVHIEVRPGGGDPIDPYYAFIQHGFTP